ncbi:MAG: hypothetical protein AB8G86_29320 [Saprospiraceae bacterium]
MKEYKILSEFSCWSRDKVASELEKSINHYAMKGWDVVTVNFTYYGYSGHATLVRDVNRNDFV